MRRHEVILVVLGLLGILLVAGVATSARRAGPAVTKTCSAAEHTKRARAVAAYRKTMPKQRAAYFRTHKKRKQRAAFVKAQQAKLAKLKHAAACRIVRPTTTTTTRPGTTTKPTTTVAAPVADLVVMGGVALAGQELRWTFVVQNSGPAPAPAARLTVVPTPGVTLVSVPAGCSGSPLVCELGVLESGGKRELVITARPPAAVGPVSLTGTATSAVADPVASNSRAAPSTVVQPADVGISLTVSRTQQVVGRTVTFTLTIANAGPATATELTATVPLPAGLELVSAGGPTIGCAGTATISCKRGVLASGESAVATVVARVVTAGTLVAPASLSTPTTPDPNAGNDAASATTVGVVPVLPPASVGPACSPSLARGSVVFVGHPSTYTEGATDYSIFIPPAGTVRTLMLFVDFSDAPASETKQAVFDHIGPQAASWFADESGGRMALQIDAPASWVRMPHSSASYGLATGGYNEQYVRDAIAAADPEVNYAPYSLVYIIPSAGAAIDRGQSPYAFGGGGLVTNEGPLHHVTFLGPTYRESWVIEHETLHHLGLPDLYDFDAMGDSARHVGGWDLMSMPVGALLAWHEWKLGWLDPAAIRCLSAPGQVEETLTPVSVPGGVKMVVVPTDASRAYVVEGREPVGRDSGLCDNGVLVYTVDATVWSGSGPIRVKDGAAATDPAAARCGMHANGALDLGPGEVSTLHDGPVTVEVLVSSPQGYRVRVTRG